MDKARWARFGDMVSTARHAIQWLSDSTLRRPLSSTRTSWRFVSITTPSYAPESNGLAEGFVHAFNRDYVNVHELRDA